MYSGIRWVDVCTVIGDRVGDTETFREGDIRDYCLAVI